MSEVAWVIALSSCCSRLAVRQIKPAAMQLVWMACYRSCIAKNHDLEAGAKLPEIRSYSAIASESSQVTEALLPGGSLSPISRAFNPLLATSLGLTWIFSVQPTPSETLHSP